MSRLVIVDCLRPAMTSNEQRSWHWRKQHQAIAVMHRQVSDALSACPVATQTNPIAIRVTWYPPNRIRRDHDSLNPFLKAAQDVIVRAGIIPDDDSRWVTSGTTAIGPVDKARPRIEIWIDTQEKP